MRQRSVRIGRGRALAAASHGGGAPRRCVATAVLITLLVTPVTGGPGGEAEACSAFCVATEEGVVCGKNLDWHEPLPGAVFVNTRGVAKRVLPWRGWWPTGEVGPTVSWMSRYGSITFSSWGRDFIAGGMNEAGLVIEEASLTAVYPADDGRPGVSCAQWMQYQLDRFASVEEVVEHLGELRPDGEGWHYLVADRTGDCAVIEYPDGRPAVFRGDGLPFRVLTNTATGSALANAALDRAFGGSVDIDSGNDSCGRFVRIAALLKDPPVGPAEGLEDFAFRVLSEVRSSEETRRTIVWLATEGRVVWTTRPHGERLWLSMSDLDLSESARTLMMDASSGGGNGAARLVGWTPEANRALAAKARASTVCDSGAVRALRERGLSFASAIDLIARSPGAPETDKGDGG